MTNPTSSLIDKPENPMAFPGTKWTPDYQDVGEGMYLRDYFAAKAMQAEVSVLSGMEGVDWNHHAACAYEVADAMLRARAK